MQQKKSLRSQNRKKKFKSPNKKLWAFVDSKIFILIFKAFDQIVNGDLQAVLRMFFAH